MQDKDYQPIDEQFTDYAWSEMRQLLDVEMPIRKKRRRGLFWLFLLLGLGLSIGAGLWWGSEKGEEGSRKVSESPIAKTEIAAGPISELEATTEKNTVQPTLLPKNQKTPEKAATLGTNRTSEPRPVSEASVTNGTDLILPIGKPIRQPGDSMAAFATGKQLSTSKAIQSQVAPEPLIPAFRQEIAITDLPLKNIPLFDFQHPETGLSRLPLSKTKGWFSQHVRLGISAGMGFGKNAGINSYMAGLAATVKLNPRWGISTGLQYRQIQRSGLAFSTSSQDFSLTPDAGSVSNPGKDTLGTSVLDPSVNNSAEVLAVNYVRQLQEKGIFRYLNLPVQVYYRLTPKIQLEGGIELSYLMRAYVRDGSDQAEKLNNRFLTNSSGPSAGTNSVLLRNWDLSGRFGLAYYPISDLGFHLNYQAGFFQDTNQYLARSSVPTDAKLSMLNNSVRFSVVYFLK